MGGERGREPGDVFSGAVRRPNDERGTLASGGSVAQSYDQHTSYGEVGATPCFLGARPRARTPRSSRYVPRGCRDIGRELSDRSTVQNSGRCCHRRTPST